jgi:hypothetical protein
VSVVVAVGITFAGVRLVAHPTALTIEPPAKTCSSDCGGTAGPGTAADSVVTVDPTQSVAGPTPLPSATAKPSPTPSAKHSRTKPAVLATAGPTPSRSSPSPSRTREARVSDPQPGETPENDAMSTQDDGGLAAAADPHVSVDFLVTGENGAGYAVRLTIRNDGSDALSGAAVEIPVSGQVMRANTSGWTQRDDGTLVITLDDLEGGGETVVRFRALGAPSIPDSCTLSTGSCVIA